MILQQTIDAVYARLDIVEVIGWFVDLKRSGTNYKGRSPFNNEKTPSFMVSPQKQIFKDFSSGKGGNAINFIMEHEHLTYPEAIKYLCGKYGIEFQETAKSEEEQLQEMARESILIINEAANIFFFSNGCAAGGREHILQRGFSPEIIERFSIGYAPGTLTALCQHLIADKGYNWQVGVQSSLIGFRENTIYDRFRDRIMFPIRNVHGRIEGFGGRAINWNKTDKFPKYLNSSDSAAYNKSLTLYGIYESKKAIVEANRCYIAEGYTDVIGFHEAGVQNIVAASGTSFTAEQARLIKRYTGNVTVLFDGDDAGMRAALRGIDVALSEGLNVKVCVLPDGNDPDDFRKGKTAEQIVDFISKNSKDFITFKLDYLVKNTNDHAERSQAITEVMNSIAKIKNPIQREIYIKECSRFTEIEPEPLKMMLNMAMATEQNFYDLAPEDFQQITDNTRSYFMEQCEARILQYLLVHSDELLRFKDIELVFTNSGTKEQFTYNEITVKDKIKTDIVDEGLAFSNIQFAQIFEIAIRSDLSDVNQWERLFGSELNLIAQELRQDEIAMDLTTFAKEGVKTYEYVMKDRRENLQNGLSEALLFFKILNVELMIEAESKKPEPNYEDVFALVDFNNNLKSKLNVL